MRYSQIITRFVRVAVLCPGLLVIGVRGAQAFEDDECSRIVTTSQHRLIDLRPGETAEMAHARAMDGVSELAVAEVIGVSVDSSQSVSSDLNNEADTRHNHDANAPNGGETAIDRSGVKSRFQDVANSNYRGLVRVKLRSEAVTGPAGHQSLDMSADVTVCQPKPKELMILDRRPPQIVDPEKVNWFNSVTGEPQLWYWAGPGDAYTFFDKAGFDPSTGDPLKRVDRPFQKEWQALQAKHRKDALDLTERRQREAALQQERETVARQVAESRAAQDARVVQGCDAGAANPNDPRKPTSVAGTSWDALKAGAATAIPDCEAAVRLQPGEPRFRYQLARAYSVDDPKRAFPLFKKLCDERYPAAYDNYGWALLDRRLGRNDLEGATRSFDLGLKAGDSDAIVSLASLIERGSVDENEPDEALQLYRRAAKLGNAGAVAVVAKLEAEQVRTEALRSQQAEVTRQEAVRQQQAAQVFMGVMSGALRNVGRR